MATRCGSTVRRDDKRTLHHDVEPMPNGNVLMIAWEHKDGEAAFRAGRDPRALGEKGLWPDVVFEVEPTRPSGGNIVWEWRVWDHLIQDLSPGREGHGVVSDHPERVDINADHRDQPALSDAEKKRLEELEAQMRALGYTGGADDDDADDDDKAEERKKRPDWLHTNAVEYDPRYDLIALSTPNLCEVWILDHSTTTAEAAGSTGGRWGRGGDLLYRWGHPRVYGAGLDEDQKLFYQHDPTFLHGPDGELRLLLFNNGGGRSDGSYSSVDELILPFDPERGFTREAGQAFGPAEPAWSYADRDTFYSGFISGSQRLPNGNTLICEGVKGRIFEVTPDKRIVWDFLSPPGREAAPQRRRAAHPGQGDLPRHPHPPGPSRRQGPARPMSEDTARLHLTQLLTEAGDREDLWQDLLPMVYDELKRIADRRMGGERVQHTLQATALVHEAWMRLVGDEGMAWSSRRHFFGAAARAMQRVLVDHARRANADKRGGGAARLSITVGDLAEETDPDRLLALDDAVSVLEREDSRAAEVARLRLFAGLEVSAVAQALEVSERTVAREWAYARARLADLLGR